MCLILCCAVWFSSPSLSRSKIFLFGSLSCRLISQSEFPVQIWALFFSLLARGENLLLVSICVLAGHLAPAGLFGSGFCCLRAPVTRSSFGGLSPCAGLCISRWEIFISSLKHANFLLSRFSLCGPLFACAAPERDTQFRPSRNKRPARFPFTALLDFSFLAEFVPSAAVPRFRYQFARAAHSWTQSLTSARDWARPAPPGFGSCPSCLYSCRWNTLTCRIQGSGFSIFSCKPTLYLGCRIQGSSFSSYVF
jgi:hypothetical protein